MRGAAIGDTALNVPVQESEMARVRRANQSGAVLAARVMDLVSQQLGGPGSTEQPMDTASSGQLTDAALYADDVCARIKEANEALDRLGEALG